VALPGVYTPASIALRVTGARKPPLRDKAVALQEVVFIYKVIKLINLFIILYFSILLH
jgi:hypothetical protein